MFPEGATARVFHRFFQPSFATLSHLRTIKPCLCNVLMAIYSRQMLSRHKTTATYGGQEEGRESMLKVRQIL